MNDIYFFFCILYSQLIYGIIMYSLSIYYHISFVVPFWSEASFFTLSRCTRYDVWWLENGCSPSPNIFTLRHSLSDSPLALFFIFALFRCCRFCIHSIPNNRLIRYANDHQQASSTILCIYLSHPWLLHTISGALCEHILSMQSKIRKRVAKLPAINGCCWTIV